MTSFFRALRRHLTRSSNDVSEPQNPAALERATLRRALAHATASEKDTAQTLVAFLKRAGFYEEWSTPALRRHVMAALVRAKAAEQRRVSAGRPCDPALNVQIFLHRSLNAPRPQASMSASAQYSPALP